MTPEELQEQFSTHLGEHLVGADVAWGELTLTVDAEGYVAAARFGRDDPACSLDLFDCLVGVDEREEGFAVVAVLYSSEHRHRVMLRHLCSGEREEPLAPSLTPIYRGADWHEREAWDMFGIEFDGHPGLAPRILTAENFEGWPLRKDFWLGTREAKPWPGLKEPLELDPETGEPLEREPAGPGAAPGPTALDEALAEQAQRAAGVLDEQTVELDEDLEVAPDAPHPEEGMGGPPGPPPDPDQPDEQGTTPAPEEGPPVTQQPGEAEVDGGLRETVDEEIQEQTEEEGGERPPSVPPEEGER